MPEASRPTPRNPIGSLALIAGVVAFVAATFAYTAGWFSPQRLTPQKLVDGFAGPPGPPLGHRRNHAKGICFTGMFEANGAGSELSHAQVFAKGQYPVVGRFNLGTPNPNADDSKERVRGLGLMISTPDGQEWRMAMIDPPFFPVASVEAFRALQIASASKEPDAMKNFAGAHPEIVAFGGWAKSAPWTGSYAEEPYNSLNSFIFTEGSGNDHVVRWSLRRRRSHPSPARGAREAWSELPRNRDYGSHQDRSGALDDAGHRRQCRRSNLGPQQGMAARPSQRRGRHADRRQRSKRKRTGRAATSISIRPSCRTEYGYRMIRSPPPARRPTGSPTTAARPRRKTIREMPREAPNDERYAAPSDPDHSPLQPLQRALHWLMAICILAMLFIGVGMVSTVASEYLTLVNIHKPLGILI